MFRPRVIPVLLLKNEGLVKTTKFKKHRYIGDPINAVKIFNDLKADELTFLDISASREGRCISLNFVKDVGEEANMPFAVGGGITKIQQIREILHEGAEKVIINTQAGVNPAFIREAADIFGSSTIVACIDVKKKLFANKRTWILGGTKSTQYDPVTFAGLMEENGAGELIVQSMEQDGMMQGYDIPLIKSISETVNIPVIALGGAGSMSDMKQAYVDAFANGLAAGSMFIYHGQRKGILINYPEKTELIDLFTQ